MLWAGGQGWVFDPGTLPPLSPQTKEVGVGPTECEEIRVGATQEEAEPWCSPWLCTCPFHTSLFPATLRPWTWVSRSVWNPKFLFPAVIAISAKKAQLPYPGLIKTIYLNEAELEFSTGLFPCPHYKISEDLLDSNSFPMHRESPQDLQAMNFTKS